MVNKLSALCQQQCVTHINQEGFPTNKGSVMSQTHDIAFRHTLHTICGMKHSGVILACRKHTLLHLWKHASRQNITHAF